MESLAEELVNDVKSPEDLKDLNNMLFKLTLEKALNAEMDIHLGYRKHEYAGRNGGNSRNGVTKKRVKHDHGECEIEIPRDREGTFEPQILAKGQRRFKGFDDQILALYVGGQTTRSISATLREMYGVDVSHTLISKVTKSVLEEVEPWQKRPLESIYPVLYLDCIGVKVHQDKQVVSKSVYLALGITLEGHKELLGMWISENEGSKFWMGILDEMKGRGVKDILIACVGGLSGFPEAINAVYPQTKVQLCIVHLIRNSLSYVSYKERKDVAADLKKIYTSLTVLEAEAELENFKEKWDRRYAGISRIWNRSWQSIVPVFEYPDEIRRIIYTTNAIESLKNVIRKSIKNRKVFPNDTSALKIIYLATRKAAQKWTMPIRNWKPALNRFVLQYEGRLTDNQYR